MDPLDPPAKLDLHECILDFSNEWQKMGHFKPPVAFGVAPTEICKSERQEGRVPREQLGAGANE